MLQGSQMMQRPKEFARIAEESVAQNMERVRQEATSRGWLSNDLPSGMIDSSSFPCQADHACCNSQESPPHEPPLVPVLTLLLYQRCQYAQQQGKNLSQSMVLEGIEAFEYEAWGLHAGWRLLCGGAGRNERIFVAGHSAGGQVAEDYALKKTGGLILLVS